MDTETEKAKTKKQLDDSTDKAYAPKRREGTMTYKEITVTPDPTILTTEEISSQEELSKEAIEFAKDNDVHMTFKEAAGYLKTLFSPIEELHKKHQKNL